MVFLAGVSAAWLALAHLRSPLAFDSFSVQVEGQPPAPITRVRLRDRQDSRVHFLLLPGYIANRSQLLHLAEVLALAGADAYVVDLPGRGDNLSVVSARPPTGPTPDMPTPNETQAALAVVRELEQRFGVEPGRLVPIGHSMGGGVALDLGRQLLPAATIALAGLERPVAPGVPPNPLFITARFDIPALRRAADKMYAEAAAGGAHAGRLEFPAIHSSLPFHTPVQGAIVDWTNRAVPDAGLAIPPYLNEKLLALESITLFFLVALFVPLCGLAAWALNLEPFSEVVPETRVSLWSPYRLLGYSLVIGATVVSLIALLRWAGLSSPLGFLGLADGDYLASVLLLATVGLVPMLRHPPWTHDRRETTKAVATAVFLAAYLLLAGGVFLTWQLYDFWPTPGGFLRAIFLLAVLFPYALGEELLLRTYSKQDHARGLSGLLLWRLGLWTAILFAALVLESGAGLLLLMTLPLAFLSLLEYFFLATLYRSLHSAYADAVLKVILLAWFIAVVFPLR